MFTIKLKLSTLSLHRLRVPAIQTRVTQHANHQIAQKGYLSLLKITMGALVRSELCTQWEPTTRKPGLLFRPRRVRLTASILYDWCSLFQTAAEGKGAARCSFPTHPLRVGQGRSRLLPAGRERGGLPAALTGRPALRSLLNAQTLPNHCTAGRTKNKTLLLSAPSGNPQQRRSFFPRSRRAAGSLLLQLCLLDSPGSQPGGPGAPPGNPFLQRRGPAPAGPAPGRAPPPRRGPRVPGSPARSLRPGRPLSAPRRAASRPGRCARARLTLVRICPEVDTLRISFWGPSCSASLSDESSPGPAEAAAGVTAAPAPAAAPPAAPGGWCWPPAPAILSESCGDTAPPGGGGGGGQGVGSARAGPGAPRPAAAAIFRSPGRPRGGRVAGDQTPSRQGPPGSSARLRGSGDADPGPPGTPAHPDPGYYRVPDPEYDQYGYRGWE